MMNYRPINPTKPDRSCGSWKGRLNSFKLEETVKQGLCQHDEIFISSSEATKFPQRNPEVLGRKFQKLIQTLW